VHPPRGAGRAEAASLAGEGDQQLVAANLAAHARESMGEDPAGEIALELSFHEAGQPDSIAGASARVLQKRTQVSANGGVQQSALGLAPAPLARERTAGRGSELFA
jgi:hypothetical protein